MCKGPKARRKTSAFLSRPAQPGEQTTKPVPRTVNPLFHAMVIVEDMADQDRLQFTVRDIGLLQESHMGGFGPRDIASISVPLQDFAGWLELTPLQEVPGNGGPVMLVDIKVRKTSAWPGEGFAADRLGLFGGGDGIGGSGSQALAGFEPNAPAEEPPVEEPQPGEPEPEELRCRGVSTSNEQPVQQPPVQQPQPPLPPGPLQGWQQQQPQPLQQPQPQAERQQQPPQPPLPPGPPELHLARSAVPDLLHPGGDLDFPHEGAVGGEDAADELHVRY